MSLMSLSRENCSSIFSSESLQPLTNHSLVPAIIYMASAAAENGNLEADLQAHEA